MFCAGKRTRFRRRFAQAPSEARRVPSEGALVFGSGELRPSRGKQPGVLLALDAVAAQRVAVGDFHQHGAPIARHAEIGGIAGRCIGVCPDGGLYDSGVALGVPIPAVGAHIQDLAVAHEAAPFGGEIKRLAAVEHQIRAVSAQPEQVAAIGHHRAPEELAVRGLDEHWVAAGVCGKFAQGTGPHAPAHEPRKLGGVVDLVHRHVEALQHAAHRAQAAHHHVAALGKAQLASVIEQLAFEAHVLKPQVGGVQVDACGHGALRLDERPHAHRPSAMPR